ncbi:hypothetical protein BHE74_00009419 [Ensete ventricosum]|nr:hypothetical protein BHE74_00009419 [Ensete ventricosum]RZS09322.1 hypothetical protein BHM03_00040393 [Ensete ventricosum]
MSVGATLTKSSLGQTQYRNARLPRKESRPQSSLSSNSRTALVLMERMNGDCYHGRATRGDEKLPQELGHGSPPGGKEGDHCRRVQQTESTEGNGEGGFKYSRWAV